MFHIGDRGAGFAVGVEHRRYQGAFNPDPLRQTGESQDSPAFPVAASYRVNEAYGEFNFPVLASLSTSAAVRYSDYSTFGGDTTGKIGFRWQPLADLGIRGTYSKGLQVGVEVNNSAIPRIRLNAQLGWNVGDWQASWIVRYIHSVTEACSNAAVTPVPGCESATDFHELKTTVYNDVQLERKNAFTLSGLRLALGVNNLFGVDPPICYTCTLNGYDAGTYDLPGAFWNARAIYKF